MGEKEVQPGEVAPNLVPRPYVEQPKWGQLFKKKGIFDDKLFCSSTKVTYTFVADKEVVSLHFDRERKTLFYKGHSVTNMKLTPIHWQHLEQFGLALEKHPQGAKFAAVYHTALENLRSVALHD